MFGLNNQMVVAYKEENMMALKNLFVKGYSGADEDDYCTAVYTQQDAYQSLSFVLDQVRGGTLAYWLLLGMWLFFWEQAACFSSFS